MPETASAKARWGRAYGMLRSSMGRQACAEGWQVQLFDFIREHERKPEGDEIEECRARARTNAEERTGWPQVARDAHTAKMKRFEMIANGQE